MQIIAQTKNQEVLPCEAYMNCDGALIGDLLNQVGYNFALDYYEFDKGEYVDDYVSTYNLESTDIFNVQNSWENYNKISKRIDKRFVKWKRRVK